MPEVITPGNAGTRHVVGEFACTGKGERGTGCGAVLRVFRDDLFTVEHSNCDGSYCEAPSTYTAIAMTCPACGTLTDIKPPNISTWDVPARARHAACMARAKLDKLVQELTKGSTDVDAVEYVHQQLLLLK